MDSRATEKLRPKIAKILLNVKASQSRNPFRGNGGFGTKFAGIDLGGPGNVSNALEVAKDENHLLSSAANLPEMAEGFKGVLSSSGLPAIYELTQPPAAPVHLDASYMLAQASNSFLGIGLDVLDGFVKVLAKWFVKAAGTPRRSSVESTPKETERKGEALAKMLAELEPLKLVKLWSTAPSLSDATRLMGEIKATIGLPAYQFDEKKQVYLVGEFA